MSNHERLVLEGRLQEAEQQAQHLAIAMNGHRRRIRELSDPFVPVGEVDLGALRVELDELQAKEQRYYQTNKLIAELREALGKPRYEER